MLIVLVPGEWAIDAERTLYRRRPDRETWLRGCELADGDPFFLHLKAARGFYPSRAVMCPRCEGQRYDVGDCALCASVGWMDARLRPLRAQVTPSLPSLPIEEEAHV